MDVALITYVEYPHLAPDDRLLLDALRERGLDAQPAIWDDPEVDWSRLRMCVVRSTWDYHVRYDEFLPWAERVAAVSQLWNPLAALRWNTHKSYLRDLSQRGVPVVPTTWMEAGSSAHLQTLLNLRGWERAVLKPAVSASAYSTMIVDRDSINAAQELANTLLPVRDLMLQPFMQSVDTHGERSLVFIDGELTHAIRRPSVLRDGEYAADKYRLVDPTEDEVQLGREALWATGFSTLYARVDVVRDDDDKLRLMELELVEPTLWLGHSHAALDRFVEGIVRRLKEA